MGTAIFLIDSLAEIVAANDEAMRLAALSSAIRDMLAVDHREGARPLTQLSVGERRYRCSIAPLMPLGCPAHERYSVLVLEPMPTPAVAVSRVRQEFKLTAREGETVELVALGLTNKEIAVRMGLSVNTVKAFLHSVMIKLGTSTRAGVIGLLVARTG